MDYHNPPSVTLICGKGQSGKTSFAYKYLINIVRACAAVFIYDPSGQSAHRLNLPWLRTVAELESAKPHKWLCFNPHAMFPAEKLTEAGPWFFRWALESSKTGRGRKILFVDELWNECSPHQVPDALLAVIKTGRFWGLDFVGVTHRPREFPIALRTNVTEWVIFHTAEPEEIKTLCEYYPNAVAAAALPTRGQCLAYNRDSGAEMKLGFADCPGGWRQF